MTAACIEVIKYICIASLNTKIGIKTYRKMFKLPVENRKVSRQKFVTNSIRLSSHSQRRKESSTLEKLFSGEWLNRRNFRYRSIYTFPGQYKNEENSYAVKNLKSRINIIYLWTPNYNACTYRVYLPIVVN